MDSVKKGCVTCKYFSSEKHGFWDPMCVDCSDESNEQDPFPRWERFSDIRTLGDMIKEREYIKVHNVPLTENVNDWNLNNDPVNHPSHYTEHPSGIECIQITEHMNFCLGNAIKYIWRAGLKSDNKVQDLEKAVWYIQREIAKEQK